MADWQLLIVGSGDDSKVYELEQFGVGEVQSVNFLEVVPLAPISEHPRISFSGSKMLGGWVNIPKHLHDLQLCHRHELDFYNFGKLLSWDRHPD